MKETAEPNALPGRDADAPLRVEWQWTSYADLSLDELYALLQLRQMVFIVEQSCPYLDADGYDARARHLLGWIEREGAPPLLGAYVRIFEPGIKYAEASIGRVITHPEMRRAGLGKILMSEAIRRTEEIAPRSDIRIGAQVYLEKFYEQFGFRRVSEPYDEDGIMHIEMLRRSRERPE